MSRVLLIDDDTELCTMLCEYLEPEGFCVDAVHSGRLGVERALEQKHDVIVLDVMLPELGGFEVLRELRTKTNIPVIMLTAKREDVDRIIGLELGADDYLPKPFNPRELVARLRAILRRASQPRTPDPTVENLLVADIEIQPATRKVFCDGELVSLTSTEFNVLLVMMHKAGQVVSKQTVTSEALGRELTAHDRSIDMHVSNLRKKLGPGADGGPRIQTIRGVGYLYVLTGES